MTSFTLVDPATSDARARDLLAAVKTKLGAVPNMMRALARAPAPPRSSTPTCR